jgi:hypothetical protein
MSTSSSDPPLIFFRTGWMRRYAGLSDGDTIERGGAWVKEHGYGHEIMNFLPVEGHVYGYVRPPGRPPEGQTDPYLSLRKLGASSGDDSLSGVTVVWVATHPAGGACIVGWYRDATVYRRPQTSPPDSPRQYMGDRLIYRTMARAEDATLLTPDERTFSLPQHQKNGMGQSNVWYATGSELGELRRQVHEYIATRQLPRIGRQNGIRPPRQPDPLLRLKVEEAAIQATTQHYRRLGYEVDSFEMDNIGWDLEARLGVIVLRLEVKGLSGSEIVVELTPNEYAMMARHQASYRLCVLTSALRHDRRLTIFSHSQESGRWEADEGLPLTITTITAARCSAPRSRAES